MRSRLRAVTFDFWNTLFIPESTLHLRIDATVAAVARLGFAAGADDVRAALDAAGALHSEAWRRGEQKGVPFLVDELDRRLGLGLEPAQREQLQEVIEDPGPTVRRRPVEGAVEAVRALRERGLVLGVVSDTGWSPGRVLRRHLAAAGIIDCFVPEALAFSDEVGVPKPDRRMFERALTGLGVAANAAAHVGDLRFTDVAGARAMGMLAIRLTAAADDTEPGPEGDLVAGSYEELARLLIDSAA